MIPSPVYCPQCWAEVGKPGCPCGSAQRCPYLRLKRALARLVRKNEQQKVHNHK